jgi:hypothetical protein
MAAQSGSFDTVKVGADWTVRVMPQLDVTLSGAVGQTIAENSVATTIASVGSFTAAPQNELFVQYGARASYEIVADTTVGAFVFGTTGDYSGTHLQVGGDLHVHF